LFVLKLKFRLIAILFVLSLFVFSGCINSGKYLGKDEYLLYKSKIKGNENIPREEYEALQRQEPNRKIFGVPVYVWIYYKADTKRISNKIESIKYSFNEKIKKQESEKRIARLTERKERKIGRLNKKLAKGGSVFSRALRPAGEKPEIFQEALAKQTVQQIELYTRSKGYFNSSASYAIDTLKKKRIQVTYSVIENAPHKFSEINYQIEDTSILKLVEGSRSESLIKVGDNYDVQSISRERERIEKLLRDNGYYYFNRQYIEFEYDSTVARYSSDSVNKGLGKRLVSLDMFIHNPTTGLHKPYTIDSIFFNLDGTETNPGQVRNISYHRGIKYSFYKKNFSRRVLNYKVFIRPGEKFSYENTIETQRQLLNLDNFKFVNIVFDTTGGKFISRINTSPANKFTTSEELGVSVSQRLPGPTINATLKNRNIFGGYENFETTARYSFEGVIASGDEVYRSEEFTASAGINFPQTLFPFNSSFKRRLNRFNPKTKLLSSYNFVNRPGFYQRANLRGSLQYTWQKGLYKFFSLTPVDLNVVRTYRIDTDFENTLDSLERFGFPLAYSFKRSIVTSINGFYTFNNYVYGSNTKAHYLNFYAESGGTTLNLVNNPDSLFQDYSIFRYIKLSLDMRKYTPIGRRSTFASRINMGIARPYSTPNNALPYEKYFFAGGSSSIRAWAPRQLGPGSYRNVDANNNKIFFENPGEILLEMSLEDRFPIIRFTSTTRLDGAFFIDAGNIWSYYKNTLVDTTEIGPVMREVRPGSDFKWNKFYKELAVGGGFGLRLNLSFLIVRVDAAYRILDPAEPEGKRFVLDNVGMKLIQDPNGNYISNPNRFPTIHLGVNYPF
jgi:outer membrane protein insertion porin family